MFKHIKQICFELILNTEQDFKFLFPQLFFSKKVEFSDYFEYFGKYC